MRDVVGWERWKNEYILEMQVKGAGFISACRQNRATFTNMVHVKKINVV